MGGIVGGRRRGWFNLGWIEKTIATTPLSGAPDVANIVDSLGGKADK